MSGKITLLNCVLSILEIYVTDLEMKFSMKFLIFILLIKITSYKAKSETK